MKSSIKLMAAAIVMTCSLASAKTGTVPLPVKVEQSDAIARVEVLSTTQVVPYFVREASGQSVPRPLKPGEYRSIAQVRVIQPIKGLQAGDVYTLEFDNGAICPNVWYKKGDECLVFNTRLPNGHYETFNTYYGKYTITENKVINWNGNSNETTPFEKVAVEITEIMQAQK